MTIIDFTFSKSKTQYDVYKYKIDEGISYNRRKAYRYKVGDIVYDLRTQDTFKYLIKIEVEKSTWKKFRYENEWEYYLTSLNLLDVVVDHLISFLKINSFYKISLPEELEDLVPYKLDPSSSLELDIQWFNNFNNPKTKNVLNLAVFHN
jgi:hypothetical protein